MNTIAVADPLFPVAGVRLGAIRRAIFIDGRGFDLFAMWNWRLESEDRPSTSARAAAQELDVAAVSSDREASVIVAEAYPVCHWNDVWVREDKGEPLDCTGKERIWNQRFGYRGRRAAAIVLSQSGGGSTPSPDKV